MKKTVAINLIRSSNVMSKIGKDTWEFSYQGETFAVINKSTSKKYYLHVKGQRFTVHTHFMRAVAALTELYSNMVRVSMQETLKALRSRYNSLEMVQYSCKSEMKHYAVWNKDTMSMRSKDRGLVYDILDMGIVTFRTELAAKAAVQDGSCQEPIMMGDLVSQFSKKTYEEIKSLEEIINP